jgi:tRNA(Ile)-lysidine synthase
MADTPTPKLTPANSPTSPLANPAGLALDGLAALKPAFELPLGVAYSGGADSTALLLAAAQRWPGQVHAIHIHHGLQAAADDFVRVCEAVCGSINVALDIVRVDATHASGESPEDAARRARYAALSQAATRLQLKGVLLGQHADDQVETLLLALSRGAGLPGLSSMAAQFVRGGVAFYRPLLQTPAAHLRAWLVQEKIEFIDDPSNTDERYTRNRIRARLLPVIEEAFPQFRETFARSAQHAAQAQALLMELAAQDLATTGLPPAINMLQGLSTMRQANALRHWLREQHQVAPSAAQLEQLLSQVAACTTRGHQIRLKVADGHVTRAGALLHYSPNAG